jgi:hypothetical protein
MYSKIAEEEDNKMTERWQKDADGILIFVSPRVCIYYYTLNWSAVGRFILCRRRYATFRDDLGPEAESPASASASGELGILSQEHLSGSLGVVRTPSLLCCQFFDILSFEIRHLGEFTLVFEPSDQSYLRNVGNIRTKMGTSIHRDHTAIAIQSTQASTASCFLFRRCRQMARFLGR